MKKCLLVSVLAVLSLCALLQPVGAQENQMSDYTNPPFTIPAFAPVRMMVSFEYTENLTHTEISGTNKTMWQFNISPTGIIFSTEAVDIFTVAFTLFYPVEVKQTVIVNIFQGSQQVETTIPCLADGTQLSMKFIISTTQEPHYPTAQELLNIILQSYPTKQDFASYTNVGAAILDMVQTNMLYQWALLVFCAALVVACVVIVFWRKNKEAA